MDTTKHIVKKVVDVAGVPAAIGITCVVVAPIAIAAAGFGAGGVVAGSAAAAVQSGIGNVVAGSYFALMQSAGVLGLAGTTQAAVGATGAVVGGALKTPIVGAGKGVIRVGAAVMPKLGSATMYVGSGVVGGAGLAVKGLGKVCGLFW